MISDAIERRDGIEGISLVSLYGYMFATIHKMVRLNLGRIECNYACIWEPVGVRFGSVALLLLFMFIFHVAIKPSENNYLNACTLVSEYDWRNPFIRLECIESTPAIAL